MSGEAHLSFEVYGLKDALRQLNTVDKKIRREITRDYKKVVQPVIDDAKSLVPSSAPLSGWERPWTVKRTGFQMFPWDSRKATSMIKAKVSGKKPKQYGEFVRELGVFYLGWYGMANTVYDMAGRKRSSVMGENLRAKYGAPSRVMWPAFNKNKDTVEDGVLEIVERVGREVGRYLIVSNAQ